jgi:7-cyano-7-deazaguanine synthase
MDENRAVVLLSGGLDSTTILALADSMGMEVTALSFRYGQRHSIELDLAAGTAARFKVKEHLVIKLDPEPFAGSALTGSGEVPDGNTSGDIPSTYVPARNTIFLAIALGIAETREAGHIFIGVNSLDYSGYPDCRPEFIEAFQKLATVATRAAVMGNAPLIQAPLMHMTKAEIIRTGIQLGVDYSKTISCYQPDSRGFSCGVCDSCRLRMTAFEANGMKDPVNYVR